MKYIEQKVGLFFDKLFGFGSLRCDKCKKECGMMDILLTQDLKYIYVVGVKMINCKLFDIEWPKETLDNYYEEELKQLEELKNKLKEIKENLEYIGWN